MGGQLASELIENVEPDLRPEFLTMGEDNFRRDIAYLRRSPALDAESKKLSEPGLFWLNGFRSGMNGVKARFIDSYAARHGRACLRFDYSGHGQSGGVFEHARVGDWLAESLHMFHHCTQGPQIIFGSSMGGWLALLIARALAGTEEVSRLKGIVLIAPATDFTEVLIWERLSNADREILLNTGHLLRRSDFSLEPDYIALGLIEEGRKHLLLGQEIRTFCPVHILQGMEDTIVPWNHSVTLVEHFAGDPVTLCLIKDGDHRLSREEDLARLQAAIETMS